MNTVRHTGRRGGGQYVKTMPVSTSCTVPYKSGCLNNGDYDILPDEGFGRLWDAVRKLLPHGFGWITVLPVSEYTILQVDGTCIYIYRDREIDTEMNSSPQSILLYAMCILDMWHKIRTVFPRIVRALRIDRALE